MDEDVLRAFRLIVREIGTDSFSPDQLLHEISCMRGKPLKVERLKGFRPDTTGCCIALEDVDLIVIRHDLDEEQSWPTLSHEGGHLLLRHIPLVSRGLEGVTYQDFVHSKELLQKHALFRDRTTRYEDEKENGAESIARLFLRCFRKWAQRPAPTSEDLYL